MSESDQDESSKTEDPTPKRMSEAREKGNIPVSREINNWAMLGTSTLVVAIFADSVSAKTTALLRFYFESPEQIPDNMESIGKVVWDTFLGAGAIIILPLLFLMLAGIISSIWQTGILFTAEQMQFNLDKLSPMKGFQRLFSMRGITEFVKGLMKLAIVGYIAFIFIRPVIRESQGMVGMEIPFMLEMIKKNILIFMGYILAVLFVVAILDMLYQHYEWIKKLRMTKQEVKDEYRQSEGDPKVKAKLKQLRIQKARQRMLQNVPKADVVITNPTHFAIALQYDMDKNQAPICTAKGHDAIALRIREIAKEHKVPIVENPPLARALYETVELEEEIPEKHYKAVAEVISYVFSLKKRH